MVVDNKQEFLYYLLTDSSIHSVDIQGSVYLPNERYMGTQLESLHLIPRTESTKVNLMAISNKGERLYFVCKDKKIELVYTRSAPPLPGSLLFNELTNQTCNLSFYNHGVFAAVLNKSKKAYLVMTNANSIQDKDETPVSFFFFLSDTTFLYLYINVRFSWKMYTTNFWIKKFGP